MIYTIKAIPTIYNHVQFRSRLEARWAAFFDLAGIEWDYEPFDLDGWAPDFLLRTSIGHVLVEVKPVDAHTHQLSEGIFDKAFNYWAKYQVLLLGLGPIARRDLLGIILDPPDDVTHQWTEVQDALMVENSDALWREAGNIVQWKPNNDDYRSQPRRIFKRKSA